MNAARIARPIFLIALFTFLVAPIIISGSVSFTSDRFMSFPPNGFSLRWYEKIAQDPGWRGAFVDTVIIGAICMVIATTVGTLSAYGISRIRSAFLRNAVLILFLSPLVVPYVAYGMAVYPIFASYRIIGTHLGVGLAQSIIAIPFVVITVISTIRRRDQVLEAGARTLAASLIQAFWHVVLPLLTPGIIAGAVLSFLTSFDDVIMPMFLGGASVSTLPKAMLDALSMSSDPSVMAASSVISLIGLITFLVITFVRRARER